MTRRQNLSLARFVIAVGAVTLLPILPSLLVFAVLSLMMRSEA